jgi:hypothetical protein
MKKTLALMLALGLAMPVNAVKTVKYVSKFETEKPIESYLLVEVQAVQNYALGSYLVGVLYGAFGTLVIVKVVKACERTGILGVLYGAFGALAILGSSELLNKLLNKFLK